MRIKYIPFFAENMEEQVEFLTKKLKFNIVHKASMYENAAGCVLKSENDDVLIAVTDHKTYKGYKNCIILSTDDCLNEYHQLMAQGLVFTKEPHYLPIGLVAEFTDPFNNRFVLIEERDYNDDL